VKKIWYIKALLTIWTLLVVVQQQAIVPNQEIVIAFAHNDITSVEVQYAVENVKKQLADLGVTNTRISRSLKNGKLSITYYSQTDVSVVKRTLSAEGKLSITPFFYAHHTGDSKDPFSKKEIGYNLEVHEIQKNVDFDTDFVSSGYVLEIKQEQEGTKHSHTYTFYERSNDNQAYELINVTEKLNTSIAIAIDDTSYRIPEVRAGPIS